MSVLQWSDAFTLGSPTMDQTHHEFVDLLARVVQAKDDEVLALWSELVEHTAEHFSREDRWMRETGFSSTNCHTTHHQAVLDVMREGKRRADLATVRQLANELGVWFPQHAQNMDAGLAMHLSSIGFDEQTGQIHRPQALPAEAIEGCHGAECSTHDKASAAEAA